MLCAPMPACWRREGLLVRLGHGRRTSWSFAPAAIRHGRHIRVGLEDFAYPGEVQPTTPNWWRGRGGRAGYGVEVGAWRTRGSCWGGGGLRHRVFYFLIWTASCLCKTRRLRACLNEDSLMQEVLGTCIPDWESAYHYLLGVFHGMCRRSM